MKLLILFLSILGCSISSNAQNNYEINFHVDNYPSDTLIVGFYYGEQTLVYDTLMADSPNKFVLAGEDTLKSGVYLMITRPDQQFMQFLVEEEDMEFDVYYDSEDPGILSFKGSDENTAFYDYLEFLKEQRLASANLQEELDLARAEKKDTSALITSLDEVDTGVLNMQESIIKKHPNSVVSLLIEANIPLEVPEYTGTHEEVQNQIYFFYRKHYFDRVHLDHPATIRTPFIHQRMDYYMEKLTPMVPDTVNNTIDNILSKMDPESEIYRYYLSHFLNKYANSKVVGFDAVYVYLTETYYATGKAPWVSEENLKKIRQTARGIKPTLIGKTAKDFTVYTEAGDTITLSEIDADYTVLFFWAPECGHCAKAIPDVKTFYEKWKDKGVEVLSICNKSGDKYADCWKSVKEKGMEGLLNVGDEKRIATILSRYYVTKTPKIFVLDRDQKIVIKGIGAQQLEEVMNNVLKMEAEKEADSSN